MADCPHHSEHVYRLKELSTHVEAVEKRVEEIEKMQKDPRITIAVIAGLSGVFTGSMAFLGVVLAPIIKAYLGL